MQIIHQLLVRRNSWNILTCPTSFSRGNSDCVLFCFVFFLSAVGPDFSKTLLKKLTLVKVGGEVIIECKPKASPRPTYSWKKGKDILRENER